MFRVVLPASILLSTLSLSASSASLSDDLTSNLKNQNRVDANTKKLERNRPFRGKGKREIGKECILGTYSWSTPCSSPNNYCFMEEGECVDPYQGTCQPKNPTTCTETNYEPVCGCDGETYDNSCAAAAKGVNILFTGECQQGNECSPSNPCRNREMNFCEMEEGMCKKRNALQRGTCQRYGRGFMCHALWSPVCGCDGKTYSNACRANTSGANVWYDGECKEKDATQTLAADDLAGEIYVKHG